MCQQLQLPEESSRNSTKANLNANRNNREDHTLQEVASLLPHLPQLQSRNRKGFSDLKNEGTWKLIMGQSLERTASLILLGKDVSEFSHLPRLLTVDLTAPLTLQVCN